VRVTTDLLQRAARGVNVVYPAFDVSGLSNINLPMFSLFVVASRCEPRCSGRKRAHTACARKQNAISAEVSGAVYGTFLGSVVSTLLAVRKSRTAYVVRTIKAVLTPAAAAASTIQGVDGHALCRGIASSRASPAQMSVTSSAYAPARMHSHLGHATTALGACAAVFATFAALTSPLLGAVSATQLERDARALLQSDALRVTLRSIVTALQRCVPTQGYTAALPQEEAAVDAEERAARRALRGVSEAYAQALRCSFSALQTMRLALDWFAKAAWPAGQLVNERTHDAVVGLMSADFFLQPPEVGPQCRTDVVPLAELQHVDGGVVSDSDASSVGTGSSGSGASSLG
jgi:hypothetical protein